MCFRLVGLISMPTTRSRMADGKFRGLPCSTAGDEHIQIGTIFEVRPQQMKLSTMNVLVLPQIASPIQILHRRRIRVIGVEITDRIGIRIGSSLATGHFAR